MTNNSPPTIEERLIARGRVRAAGRGLILTAALHYLVLILVIAGFIASSGEQGRGTEEIVTACCLTAFWLLSGLVITAGGLTLLRLDSYGVAESGCVAAMIPGVCLFPPFGFPVGLWANILASSPDVRRCFRDRKR